MLETRKATVADAGLITRHRKAMFADIHDARDAILDAMSRSFNPWVIRMLAAEKYIGWITSDGDLPVASAGLLVLDWPPHFLDPDAEQRGYILNIYVEPAYRKRGLARELVKLCMAESHNRGMGVVALHASPAGRPMYEKLGFESSNEMKYVEARNTET
jgi:ribosomal protein S18 acetylase RimI-like enzyme